MKIISINHESSETSNRSNRGGYMERIGFIGIGLMGQHMAAHLLSAGHRLTVWNRTKEKTDKLITDGAAWANSPKAVAAVSEC